MLHRLLDRFHEWRRYPQPDPRQRLLLGQYTDSIDVDFTARRMASEQSAEYMVHHMRHARNFTNDYDLHEWVATQINKDLLVNGGMIMEFGVATGRTLNHWARLFPYQHIFGFDSFQGLPEDWTWYIRKGHFQQRLPRVRKNCRLQVGWFNDTLRPFLEKNLGPVSLLHIDCDLYSSTKYVLDCLRDRIRVGTVIVFDEYFNFPGWQQDEFRAWREFCNHNGIRYEYIGMVTRHQKVAVRVTSLVDQ